MRLWLAVCKALDWLDNRGQPDHGKLMPGITLIWLLILASAHRLPGVANVIALLAASFGYGSWRTFLRSRDSSGARTT